MADGPRSPEWYRDIVASYDSVAEEYASHYSDELSHKPFDRKLLTRFVELIPQGGLVCDLGCGPGHVARFLAGLGANVLGIDISPAMVEVARKLNPRLTFEQGDMLRLSSPNARFAGIAAFYSLIHIDRPRVPQALGELLRVLAPDGRLIVSFHVGEGEIHRDEFLGKRVWFHASLFGTEEMTANLTAAGFVVEEVLSREPYEFEYPSQRAYIVARKPRDLFRYARRADPSSD